VGVGGGRGGGGGGGGGEDPLGPRYSVHFPGSSGVEAETGAPYDEATLADPSRFVHMTAHDGKRYACELPAGAKGGLEGARVGVGLGWGVAAGVAAGAAAGEASSPEGVEEALEEALMVGVDAAGAGGLVGGTATPCFYRKDGWWTYEYCWRRHVRQYHEKELDILDPQTKKVVGKKRLPVKNADFYLGWQQQPVSHAAAATRVRTSGADGLAEEERVGVITQDSGTSTVAGETYYSHFLGGGTKCDLTGEPREVEVRFTCSKRSKELSSSMISSVREVKTCQYVLNFESYALCQLEGFHAVGEDPVHAIQCYDFPKPPPAQSI